MGKEHMKKIFLLGLAVLGLIALAPAESKADDGFRIYISPHSQYRPYYYGGDRYRYHHHADEYRWQRWHRYHHRHHYERDHDRNYDRD
jgi:hypothetical protein